MTKTAFVILALALVPFGAFAVDGVTLINQSTVMAAGGFPYRITQPGSYKLSGNLTVNTSTNGNNAGLDVAILVSASNVILDLNGFSITFTNNISNLSHAFFAIAEGGAYSNTSVRNGTITEVNPFLPPSSPYGLVDLFTGIYLFASTNSSILELSITTRPETYVISSAIQVGPNSLTRHVITNGHISVTCSALVVQSVYRSAINGSLPNGCPIGSLVGVNNVEYATQ